MKCVYYLCACEAGPNLSTQYSEQKEEKLIVLDFFDFEKPFDYVDRAFV